MTPEERAEHRREYQRKRRQTEERKAQMRARNKATYWKKKREQEQKALELKKLYDDFPKAPDILKTDCCVICKSFSGTKGMSKGWCMKSKRGTSIKDICGYFDPIQNEAKFTKVIYKTPGVKYIKGTE